jgi:hypothetical protein
MRRLLPVASLFFCAVLMADAAAQVLPPAKEPALAAPPPAAKRPVVPAPEALLIMIRSTLIALHHGNVTGNYTVLRDLAAPGFQAANSAASLGQIFGNLRAQRIDLAPALLLTPELVQGPAIGDNGLLSLAGFLATQPLRINFQIMFQAVDGMWRPFGIAINPAPAATEGSPASNVTSGKSVLPGKAKP